MHRRLCVRRAVTASAPYHKYHSMANETGIADARRYPLLFRGPLGRPSCMRRPPGPSASSSAFPTPRLLYFKPQLLRRHPLALTGPWTPLLAARGCISCSSPPSRSTYRSETATAAHLMPRGHVPRLSRSAPPSALHPCMGHGRTRRPARAEAPPPESTAAAAVPTQTLGGAAQTQAPRRTAHRKRPPHRSRPPGCWTAETCPQMIN